MKLFGNIIIAVFALMAWSCERNEDSVQNDGTFCIKWYVNDISKRDTKALIGEQSALENACSPSGGKESIGLWGDYDAVVNGVTQTTVGFFKATELVYYGIGPFEDSPTGWDYNGEDRYWTWGGNYRFRAYFPQKGVNVVSSSNATTFVFEWNSMLKQLDLMVAYREINTRTWDLNKPVPLNFNHALSALKFNFQFTDGYVAEDKLTGLWLENTAEDDFASIGIMAYGATEETDDPEAMTWTKAYANEPGSEIYKWTYAEGIPFFRTADNVSTMATAYTTGFNDGREYIDNEGWLLIIPQESSGNVNLCFTTEKSGSHVYRTTLPANTGTDNTFKPGYKYDYTVTIGETDLRLDLSIAEWNRLESSYDIKF